jgi:hypothetical protein
MIQIKLVGMSMNFCKTKVHLYIFAVIHTALLNDVRQVDRLVLSRTSCLFLTKTVSLKVVHPLKIYHYTKFHVPTLIDASFVSISEV